MLKAVRLNDVLFLTPNFYIDAYGFLILKSDIAKYQKVAKEVANIWVEHGALAHHLYLEDDLYVQ